MVVEQITVELMMNLEESINALYLRNPSTSTFRKDGD